MFLKISVEISILLLVSFSSKQQCRLVINIKLTNQKYGGEICKTIHKIVTFAPHSYFLLYFHILIFSSSFCCIFHEVFLTYCWI